MREQLLLERSGLDAITTLLLGSVIFGKAMLSSSVSIGDILYIASALLCMPAFVTKAAPREYWIVSVPFVLLVIWAVINYLVASLYRGLEPPSLFWGSYAKLLVYALGGLPILMHLFSACCYRVMKSAKVILLLSTAAGLLALTIQYINQQFSLEIPVWGLWFGLGGPLEFGEVTGVLKTDYFTIHKVRGFFMEPSLYGIFSVMVLSIFSREKNIRFLSSHQEAIVVLSIALTFSLTSYGLLAIFLAVSRRKTLRHYILEMWPYLIFACLFVFYYRDPIIEFIVQRAAGVVAGDDRSASLRWLGSFDTMYLALQTHPILGSSLGYLASLPKQMGIVFEYQTDVQEWVRTAGNTQVVWFYILGSLGPIGFVTTLASLALIFRQDTALWIIIVASGFAHGAILESIYWGFVLLALHRSWVRVKRSGV